MKIIILTALFVLAACQIGHADEYSCFGAGRYDAMSDARECPPKKEPPAWKKFAGMGCTELRNYLQSHSIAEAREEAARLHFPGWVIRQAERCLK